MRSNFELGLLCAGAVWLSACGALSTRDGFSCGTGVECASGSCMSLDAFPPDGGSTCVVGPKVCTKSCTTAADCSSLDQTKHWACFSSCGGTKFCGAID